MSGFRSKRSRSGDSKNRASDADNDSTTDRRHLSCNHEKDTPIAATRNLENMSDKKLVNAVSKVFDAQIVPDLIKGMLDLRNALLKSVIFGSHKSHQDVGICLSEILQREIWACCSETDYSEIHPILELFTERNASDAFNREMPKFLGNTITELGDCGYPSCTIIKHLGYLEDDLKSTPIEKISTKPRSRASDDAVRLFDYGRVHKFPPGDLSAQIDRSTSISKAWMLCNSNSRDEILELGRKMGFQYRIV